MPSASLISYKKIINHNIYQAPQLISSICRIAADSISKPAILIKKLQLEALLSPPTPS